MSDPLELYINRSYSIQDFPLGGADLLVGVLTSDAGTLGWKRVQKRKNWVSLNPPLNRNLKPLNNGRVKQLRACP